MSNSNKYLIKIAGKLDAATKKLTMDYIRIGNFSRVPSKTVEMTSRIRAYGHIKIPSKHLEPSTVEANAGKKRLKDPALDRALAIAHRVLRRGH